MHTSSLLVLSALALTQASPTQDSTPKFFRVDLKRPGTSSLQKRSTSRTFNSAIVQHDLDRIARTSPKNVERYANYVRLHPQAATIKKRSSPVEPFDVASLRRRSLDVFDPTDIHLAKRQATTQAVSLTVDSVFTMDNCYYGDVSFGTPAQVLTIDFDTGSADLWVPDQAAVNAQQGGTGSLSDNPDSDLPPVGDGTTNGAAEAHTPFIESQSSSFESSTTPFSIRYGSGQAAGTLARDVVAIGNVSVAQQVFAVVDQTSSTFARVPFDGLMGLAYSTIAESGQRNFFENLVQNGDLSSPVFAFRLGRSSESGQADPNAEVQIPNQGTLLFGGIDSDDYTGSIAYQDVTTRGYWETSIAGVEVGGTIVSGTANMLVAWDSGTSLAYFPETAAAAVARAIGAQPEPSLSSLAGGTLYVLECDAIDELTISISFGGQSFEWASEDLNGGTVDNRGRFCALNIIGSDANDPVGNPVAIIGDSFLKNTYSIYDFGNDRVGLAVASGNPAPSGSSSIRTPNSNNGTENNSQSSSSAAAPLSLSRALCALLITSVFFLTK